MEKLITFATAFVVIGVAFVSTTVSYTLPPGYEKAEITVDANLSFIAPIPLNYTVVPIVLPHEISMDSYKFYEIRG
ncbi:MAG TPA: hypothetical protein ENG71_04010 [Thermoplasmatales archaeon]|nr:hypothetical protein [Thermoplasmatales archaeon]